MSIISAQCLSCTELFLLADGKFRRHSLTSDSAIGLHLLQNTACAQHYDDSRFSSLPKAAFLSIYLSALEPTSIKTSNPAFCQQKEFEYSLNIVH